ncbi:family 4 glycosyltransferase [Melampsora americana]|nr:family 4 glycosyltransferase [Melampsora americana]
MKLIHYCFQLFSRSTPILKLIIILIISIQSIYLSYLIFNLFIKLLSKRLHSLNQNKRYQLINQTLDHSNHQNQNQNQIKIIGFFHPYCNAGGGGERVLWTAVSFHQRSEPNTICAIYTGDLDITKSQMISKVKQRFDINLDPYALILIPLKTRYLVESSTWPRFTLIGQSLGSMVLGYEALSKLIPDIYIDTMGYAFTFPIFSNLTSIPIGAYVHYPTISTNMLKRVTDRTSNHHNSTSISSSLFLSYLKVLYYLIFAELYSICLKKSDFLMVNSTWTKSHIDKLLKSKFNHQSINSSLTKLVYPPCDITTFKDFPLLPRKSIVLSISQYRPEKDQIKQIEAFSKFMKMNDEKFKNVRMILVGSCRNQEDLDRVEFLKKRCIELNLEDKVELKVNVEWDELKTLLSEALVGISTMIDEHFGISIVEFMASGLVPLVHSSGGPLMDIIQSNQTGYFATDSDSFANQLETIFNLSEIECQQIRMKARRVSEEKFSVQVFEEAWEDGIQQVLKFGQSRVRRKDKVQ